jgi:hypothetical protein
MASRQLGHILKITSILDPASYTSTQTSAAIDMQGYESLRVVALVGVWTSGTFDFKLQECDTVGGTYTDVAAGDVFVSTLAQVSSAANDQIAQAIDYMGTKRFVKMVGTGATTPSAVFGMLAIQGHPRVSV